MSVLRSLCFMCILGLVVAEPFVNIEGNAMYLGPTDKDCKLVTKCHFRCDVRVNVPPGNVPPVNVSFQAAPLVEWQRLDAITNEWKGLRDEIWLKRRVHYSSSHSASTCRRIDGETYRCVFQERRCCSPRYDGVYRCNISASLSYISASQSSSVWGQKIEEFHKISLLGSDHTPLDQCFMPSVINLRAGYDDDNNNSIVLNWDTTSLPPNGVLCDRSRRFMVKVLTFKTYNDYQLGIGDLRTSYLNTTMRRDTTFTFPLSGMYTLQKYYLFELRNRHISGVSEHRVERTQVHTSNIFFFGNQEPASLVHPASYTTTKRVLSGSSLELRCEASGSPTPTASLWFKGNIISSISDTPSVAVKSLVMLPELAGRYQCSAINSYISSSGGAFPAFALKFIDVHVFEEDTSTGLICSAIEQTKCRRFLSNQKVLFNTSHINLQDEVESAVSVLEQAAANSSGLMTECLNLAQAVLCHSVFPFCYDIDNPRKVCKNTCDLFRPGGHCASIVNQETFPIAHQIILSNCDSRIDPAGSYPECVHVPFENKLATTSWCNRGRGLDYAGDVTRTTSNRICQEWISEEPHRHPIYSGTDLHFARSECRNPGGLGDRPWCYTSDRAVRWEYCDNVPQCEVCSEYTGTFCQDVPGYDRHAPVYVNRHESEWNEGGLAAADVWMLQEFYEINPAHSTLPVSCLTGIKELICHKTLPLCNTQSGDSPVSMKLCSDHCKASKLLQVCPGNVFQTLQADFEESQYNFSKLECEVQTESNGACLTSGVLSLVTSTAGSAMETRSCYNESNHGQGYAGSISTTSSGTPCQPWGSYLSGAENYCRNPGQVAESPWCFTNPELSEWERCDIPTCDEVVDSHVTEKPSDVPQRKSFTIALIVFFILLGLGIILFSILLSVIVCYMRKKRIESRSVGKTALTSSSGKWDYVRNTMYAKVEDPSSSQSSKIKQTIESFPQFDKASIHYIRQLGQGNFGVVFYAKAEGLLKDEKETEVAVKTLKEETSNEALSDFVREAKLMFSFKHQNIVKIFGVAMESVPYYLVFEYMDKGDLTQFLRTNASSLQRRLMNPFNGRPRSRTESTLSDDPPSLNSEQLTDICEQIACGMQHLAENKHVHRDLACRNCLVKSCDREQTESGLIIKIGDFGMSHNLYNADYYRVKGSAILPVRWMSPEAIIYGKFSTESDVWSFGVVMWEVFSFAMQPYYGTSNEEVTEAIRRHKILKQPTDCPNSIYEIMKQCWNLDSALRPTFEELYTQLDEAHSESSGESPSMDDFNSNSSDLDSDAFLEENSVDELDAAL